jgi:hypothetical protein
MMQEVRLGVIVPSVNTAVGNWYPKIVPDAVSTRRANFNRRGQECVTNAPNPPPAEP